MTAEAFEARIVEWALSRSDVKALIQIGSRAQSGAVVDEWSDWDYHLIVNTPARYKCTDWLEEIAPCWSAHSEFTERGVTKISAVFSGGREIDFVPLAAWQMKLVYWAMARPKLFSFYPKALLSGIANTRLVVAPGYRVVVGGPAWERRLSALTGEWPKHSLSVSEFDASVAGFWRHAVWVHKKIMRGETRAALRWYHRELSERSWILLEEEAKISGRPARPEARQAEHWLDARRLAQTAIVTSPEQQVLARAFLLEINLFEDISRSVAGSHAFVLPDYSAVADWMRSDLGKLTGPS